jgi:hypothetical protein
MSLMMGSRQTTSHAYACTPQRWTQCTVRHMFAQILVSQLLWPAAIPQDAYAAGGNRTRHGGS